MDPLLEDEYLQPRKRRDRDERPDLSAFAGGDPGATDAGGEADFDPYALDDVFGDDAGVDAEPAPTRRAVPSPSPIVDDPWGEDLFGSDDADDLFGDSAVISDPVSDSDDEPPSDPFGETMVGDEEPLVRRGLRPRERDPGSQSSSDIKVRVLPAGSELSDASESTRGVIERFEADTGDAPEMTGTFDDPFDDPFGDPFTPAEKHEDDILTRPRLRQPKITEEEPLDRSNEATLDGGAAIDHLPEPPPRDAIPAPRAELPKPAREEPQAFIPRSIYDDQPDFSEYHFEDDGDDNDFERSLARRFGATGRRMREKIELGDLTKRRSPSRLPLLLIVSGLLVIGAVGAVLWYRQQLERGIQVPTVLGTTDEVEDSAATYSPTAVPIAGSNPDGTGASNPGTPDGPVVVVEPLPELPPPNNVSGKLKRGVAYGLPVYAKPKSGGGR